MRVPFYRRRAPGEGHHGGREQGPALTQGPRRLLVVLEEEGSESETGATGSRRLGERDFTAAAPNELSLTDITEHLTAEGKLYLCAVEDFYSCRIVGYSMDAGMKSSLAVSLENAIRARPPAGTVVRSDRGSQFGFSRFVESLRRHELTVSMARVPAMESFFALLQKTVLNRQR